MPLDKSRKFGEVHGIAKCSFEQDGKFFNLKGYEVDVLGRVIEVEPEAEPKRRGRPKKILNVQDKAETVDV